MLQNKADNLINNRELSLEIAPVLTSGIVGDIINYEETGAMKKKVVIIGIISIIVVMFICLGVGVRRYLQHSHAMDYIKLKDNVYEKNIIIDTVSEDIDTYSKEDYDVCLILQERVYSDAGIKHKVTITYVYKNGEYEVVKYNSEKPARKEITKCKMVQAKADEFFEFINKFFKLGIYLIPAQDVSCYVKIVKEDGKVVEDSVEYNVYKELFNKYLDIQYYI